jgi:glycyl-tRNA synthetase
MLNLTKTEKITNIATKRGFFYPSAEIYGSKAGFWTYGHLGTLMKNKWENLWRDYFLNLSDNYFEIHDCNILPKEVFKSSGHLENFNDPLTTCKKCGFRFRADELIEDELNKNVESLTAEQMYKIIKDNKLKCPKCNSPTLSKIEWFNMMFDIKVGAKKNEIMYLRGETAQSPYLAFKRQILALREKIPMGLAIIGNAFRNEISPRQGFFRLREFTQAELQIFFDPEKINEAEDWNSIKNYKLRLFLIKNRKQNKIIEITCEKTNKELKLPKFYVYHAAKIQQFYINILKIPKDKFRFRELSEKERAFYNRIHFDIEINLETLGGFKEVGGLHYRGDHDLGGHQKGSKDKLEILKNGKKLLPHVLELSFGVDRNIWTLLDIFYREEKERTYFDFPALISPFETAVFPLVRNKQPLLKKSKEVYEFLRKNFKTFYDETGSIGRRYRRAEEVGINSMITVDFDTLKDNSVTLRDRNSMKQIRVKISKLKETLQQFLEGKPLKELGEII